jgi:hypothetical protein
LFRRSAARDTVDGRLRLEPLTPSRLAGTSREGVGASCFSAIVSLPGRVGMNALVRQEKPRRFARLEFSHEKADYHF